jgi:pyruvate/2-oxoglutarate/acetoin dehydrogenase E1 component
VTRQISFAVALNEALKEEMRRDPTIFVAGEDVGRMGGLFKVTQDLLEEFGSSRVLDTPISEAAIAGLGVGGALVGTRPIIEFQFVDFVTIAMDQIINHGAKLRYMTGGMLSVPLVIRAPVCGGIGLGAQHSQSLEAWFVHVPGIKVVMPATPGDAKGLLKSAIRDDNPVLFLEHRRLYAATGDVPSEEYVVPLGKAEVRREGSDITVVSTGRTVSLALAAAERLSKQAVNIEVIDLRTLKPFDMQTVSNSVRKTNRAVVVNDGWRTCGYAAEIVASIQDECFYDLDVPIQRVCNKDAPMPVAAGLERSLMVSEEQIVAACREAMSV